ncbi:MAG: hypothetical protein HC937_02475 [Aquincola sp.]|nr:hypothetical protein [Aquincola sp.]
MSGHIASSFFDCASSLASRASASEIAASAARGAALSEQEKLESNQPRNIAST